MKYTPLVILLFMAAFFSCKQQVQEQPVTNKIRLTDSLQQLITLDTASMRNISSPLQLSGQITFAQDKVVEVVPLFGGNVTEVYVELGDYVEKGALLATIRSSEVADYQQQEIEIKANLEVAQKNLDIAMDMARSGLSSQKEVLVARTELDNAKAQLQKIKEIISINNISDNSTYSLKSPVSGFVVEKNINREMQLRSDNNTDVFTISGLDEVWVTANVYESDITKIQLNNPAQVRVTALPGEVWNTRIEKIYNILDSESKTMTIRMKLANPGYKLKPGMFAQVNTENAQLKAQEKLCIDKNAVIFDNNKNQVVVLTPDNEFELREVILDTISDDYAAISSGLNVNERIVKKNALLVYNAILGN